MSFDSHANLAASLVAVAPSPASSGTSLTVTAGQGALFPAAPFNCIVCPANTMPSTTNAEIVRVTNVAGDVFTISRHQEGTSARSILAGDFISNAITAKTFTDIESAVGGGGGVAISAGTQSTGAGTVVFSNSNNISFGLSNGTITASYGDQDLQGIIAGSQTATGGSVLFQSGNGVTFGMSNSSVITASVATSYRASNDAVGLNTALTANGVSWTVNSSGVSLNVPAFLTTAQAPGNYLTTARASNDAVGLNTALTANGVSWTVNSSGLSLNIPAFLTTAMQSNAATISNINVSAGATSANLSALTFNNGNGITFGLTNSIITASIATSLPVVNFSAGANSGNLGSVVFSNSNGISFGLNGSTITANVGVLSQYDPPVWGSSMATNSTLGQNTLYFQPFDLQSPIYAYRLNLFASVGTSISATNVAFSAGYTGSAALYARDTANTTQITSFWSCSFPLVANFSSNSNITVTHPFGISNSTAVSTTGNGGVQNVNASTYLSSSVAGFRVIPLPVFSTLSPGRYWLAYACSTSTAGTSNGAFQLSMMQATQGNLAFRPFGAVSAASNASFLNAYEGLGTLSATSNAFPGSIVMNSNTIMAAISNTRVFFNLSGYTTATNIL